MKKITFIFIFLLGLTSYAQVNINESFDSGTPAGWTDDFTNTDDGACAGFAERHNTYGSNTSANLTSPNLVAASNATDLNISFDYKVIEYYSDFGGTPDTPTPAGWGSAELQYSTDDGITWVTILTIDDSNHVSSGSCATMMATVPAASLPTGSDVKLQIINTYVAGDYFFYVDNFTAQQDLGCTAAEIGVISTVEDCANGQFAINVDVTAVNDATQLNDGTNTYAISGTGIVTAGPYPSGTSVNLTVEHSIAACNFDLAQQVYFCPPTNDDCASAIPVTVGFGVCGPDVTGSNIGASDSGLAQATCTTSTYAGGDIWYSATLGATDTQLDFSRSVNEFSTAVVELYSGTCGALVEVGCTQGDSASFTGLVAGGTYYLRIYDWGNDDFGVVTFCLSSPTCTNATVAYGIVNDCDNSGGFFVETDVTDMGSASTITVSDDQGGSLQISSPQVVSFGPYVNGTDVIVTVLDDSDASCEQMSGTLTQEACPPANDACVDAIVINDGDSILGTTLGATNIEALTACSAGGGSTETGCAGGTGTINFGAGVWYVYTAQPGDIISVTTDNSPTPFDTEIQVFSGDCGNLVCVGGDDDGGAIASLSTFCWESSATEDRATVDYFIYVDGHSTNTGDFQLDISVANTLSTTSLENEATFTYFPNPVKNTLTLNAQNTIENVTMYNMLGQEVLRATPNSVDSDLDMSNLQIGTYFVQVTIANVTKTIRVVKQ